MPIIRFLAVCCFALYSLSMGLAQPGVSGAVLYPVSEPAVNSSITNTFLIFNRIAPGIYPDLSVLASGNRGDLTSMPGIPGSNPLAFVRDTEDILRHYGIFCRMENRFAKRTRLHAIMRLGSDDYVDWLEGK